MQVEHRIVFADVRSDDLEYVISDETKDRHGTVLSSDGWQLANFRKHPIALFNHDPSFVVGKWENVRVEGKKLLGRLTLLPPGVSERLNEIRIAAEAGILRAVSVGFRLLEHDGDRYTKMELLEVSLVSVPSNPNALSMARSLHLSDGAQNLIFGEPAGEDEARRRRSTGKPAAKSTPLGNRKMTLSEQIEAAQARLTEARDHKNAVAARMAETDEPGDELIAELETANEQIARQQRIFNALNASEQANGQKAEPVVRTASTALAVRNPRPFAAPAEKVKPADLMVRSMVVGLLSHLTRRDPAAVLAERYQDHPDTGEVFRHFHGLETRAASAPATTSTSGWASQLIETVVGDFLETIVPNAIYPRLAALGQRYTFGRSGSISIPVWDATPTIAGGFVLEGAAIPVKQGALSSTSLTPKKMAVITTFTREIAEHSTPAIEGLLRQKIQSDTSVALDTVLLDATAVSTTRPAGLRNGVSETTATAGGGIAAFIADLQAHIAAVQINGSLTRPVMLMNPANALAVGYLQNAGGDFPFEVGLEGGNLRGIPVLVSSTVTADMIITVDAAWFASVTGDEPRFDVSDQATLHMEDTTPLAIGTAGAPNTVAAPVRSLFQTDSLALRMILPMNWIKVRSGIVAWTSSVTW